MKLFIGMDVWWYGDLATSTPCAAKITKIENENENMVTLAIFPPNSTVIKTHRAVRHKSDPWYSAGPERFLALTRTGCWDYVESKQPAPQFKFAPKPEKVS